MSVLTLLLNGNFMLGVYINLLSISDSGSTHQSIFVVFTTNEIMTFKIEHFVIQSGNLPEEEKVSETVLSWWP